MSKVVAISQYNDNYNGRSYYHLFMKLTKTNNEYIRTNTIDDRIYSSISKFISTVNLDKLPILEIIYD